MKKSMPGWIQKFNPRTLIFGYKNSIQERLFSNAKKVK